jgi:hypothetical protein
MVLTTPRTAMFGRAAANLTRSGQLTRGGSADPMVRSSQDRPATGEGIHLGLDSTWQSVPLPTAGPQRRLGPVAELQLE